MLYSHFLNISSKLCNQRVKMTKCTVMFACVKTVDRLEFHS